jgi:hypothetical protein
VLMGETRNVCRIVAGKTVERVVCWAEDRDQALVRTSVRRGGDFA